MDLEKIIFWAKTFKPGDVQADSIPGIDVFHHMMNVGHVALNLSRLRQGVLTMLQLDSNVCALLSALHDIGKLSPGFQVKCPAWIEVNGLSEHAVTHFWDSFEPNHSKVSQFTLQRWLAARYGLPRKSANALAAAVAAHHGKIVCSPADRGANADPSRGLLDSDDWEIKRKSTADAISEIFHHANQALPTSTIDMDSPELWWLAGLTSVSDWIGSDERYFPADKNLPQDLSLKLAQTALDDVGFSPLSLIPDLGFSDIFPFSANDLQYQAMEAIKEPGVYVIEAPMGMGKTEAALACSYQLMNAGLAEGIYFALPTQATSNRIFLRFQSFVEKVCPGGDQSARLIHANSWLLENIKTTAPAKTLANSEDARIGRDWFASSKRSLLARFGVGTVDQALLSVVAAKHFFVRRFALAGKVIILDEIHSYDIYTGTLIRELCRTLKELGCTVILLSATLTPQRRNDLLGLTPSKDHDVSAPYPMISGYGKAGEPIPDRMPLPPESSEICVSFKQEDELLSLAWQQAQRGTCVLWICDTVSSAQRVFRAFRDMTAAGEKPDVGLLHSRFPLYRREELESHWMEALGKNGMRPEGSVLVSTQEVEQSVDLDADLMITELAPTDMMLQRMGRLWRHTRKNRPVEKPKIYVVSESQSVDEFRQMTAKQISRSLGGKATVYAPYVLLRSLELWASNEAVKIPSDIRPLLQKTYQDRDQEPEAWIELRNQLEGDAHSLRKAALMSSNIWTVALNDDEGVQTRINSYEQVSLILARSIDNDVIELLNCDHAQVDSERYDIHCARALHRNLVRVPKDIFQLFTNGQNTARYVRGDQALAQVASDGVIHIPGLKEGRGLRWDDQLGVSIIRDNTGA